MKLFHFLFPLCMLALTACSDKEDTEDMYDLEWNQNLEIAPNTMRYIDSQNNESSISLQDFRVTLTNDIYHNIEFNVPGIAKIAQFAWKEQEKFIEISPRIVGGGIAGESGNIITLSMGKLKIIEAQTGKWDQLNKANQPSHGAKREVRIKATFHLKTETTQTINNMKEVIESSEIKGVIHFTGYEEFLIAMGYL